MSLDQGLYPQPRGSFPQEGLGSFDFLKQGYLIHNEFTQASKSITYKSSDDGRSSPNQLQNKRLGQIYKIFPKGSDDNQEEEDHKLSDHIDDGPYQPQRFLVRVVALNGIKAYKIQEVWQEIKCLVAVQSQTQSIVPIQGVHFKE
jgi:hypothetical protein